MELGIQIGGVLLALVFLVFLILGRKSWKWFHMVMLFLVMAAAMTFLIYAAMANKTRRTWAEYYKKENAEAEKLAKEAFEIEHGDPTRESEQRGLTELRGELTRVTEGVSNVYRDCRHAGFDGTSEVVVTIPPPPALQPAAPLPGEEPPAEVAAPAPALTHSIVVDSTVYAFVEDNAKLPIFYVGEFHVTAATGNTVTLRPMLPPYRAPGGNWTLYEEIPLDRQNYLTDLRDPEVMARLYPGANLNDKQLLEGRFTPANLLGLVRENPNDPDSALVLQPLTPNSQKYKDFIDQFRFDGMPIAEINKIRAAEGSPEFDPPPMELWAKIEFVDPAGEGVGIPVDSPELEMIIINWSALAQQARSEVGSNASLTARLNALQRQADAELVAEQRNLQRLAEEKGLVTVPELEEAYPDEFKQFTGKAANFYTELLAILQQALANDVAQAKFNELLAANTQMPQTFDRQGRAIRYDLRRRAVEPDFDMVFEGGQRAKRAVDFELNEPVEVSFENSDKGQIQEFTVIKSKADEFIQAGQAKLIADIFKRKLNDFRYHFREVYDLKRDTETEIAELNQEIKRMNDATANYDAQASLREDEQGKLSDDKDKFVKENETVKEYAVALQDELDAKEDRIRKLLDEIATYETRLAAMNQRMEEAVQQNAQAVSAGSP